MLVPKMIKHYNFYNTKGYFPIPRWHSQITKFDIKFLLMIDFSNRSLFIKKLISTYVFKSTQNADATALLFLMNCLVPRNNIKKQTQKLFDTTKYWASGAKNIFLYNLYEVILHYQSIYSIIKFYPMIADPTWNSFRNKGLMTNSHALFNHP